MILESRSFARAGLLGNPSDGYFGKTISISVRNFSAHISLYETPDLQIIPQEDDRHTFKNIYHLVESISSTGYYGAERLIKAAIRKFFEYVQIQKIRLNNKNFTIRYLSSIPRQVGLAGSSAIITATIKALMKFYEISIPLEIIPNITLAAETEELGINAGLQDRVIQAYEGCVYMDFNQKKMIKDTYGSYVPINPKLLKNLFIAYKTDLSKVSGKVLNTVKEKYENKDPETIQTLAKIGDLAQLGKEAIEKQDFKALNELINENFELRKKIMPISESNIELVQTARNCDVSAKFAGSGGSIIGFYPNDESLNKLIVNMKKIKARVIKPYII